MIASVLLSGILGDGNIFGQVVMAMVGSTVITALVTNYYNRTKNKAETESIIAETYSGLVKDIQEQKEAAQKKADHLEKVYEETIKTNNILMAERMRLTERVRQLEIDEKERTKLREEMNNRVKEIVDEKKGLVIERDELKNKVQLLENDVKQLKAKVQELQDKQELK